MINFFAASFIFCDGSKHSMIAGMDCMVHGILLILIYLSCVLLDVQLLLPPSVRGYKFVNFLADGQNFLKVWSKYFG